MSLASRAPVHRSFDSEKAGDREVQRTMLELLNQLDGFQPNTQVKVNKRQLSCWADPGIWYWQSWDPSFPYPDLPRLVPVAGCTAFQLKLLLPLFLR